MQVQVRRGAPFRLKSRTAVRAARTRSSKPASRVRLPGGTRNGVRRARCCPTVWPGPARPLSPLPAGRIGRSPPKAALGVRISPGRHVWSGTHLGSEAAVYRPRRVRFSSGPQSKERMAAYPNLRQRDHVENVFSIGSNPIAATPPGYPNQQRTPAQTRCVAGATPVPGTSHAKGA